MTGDCHYKSILLSPTIILPGISDLNWQSKLIQNIFVGGVEYYELQMEVKLVSLCVHHLASCQFTSIAFGSLVSVCIMHHFFSVLSPNKLNLCLV